MAAPFTQSRTEKRDSILLIMNKNGFRMIEFVEWHPLENVKGKGESCVC